MKQQSSENSLTCKQVTKELYLCTDKNMKKKDYSGSHACFSEESDTPMHHERVCLGAEGRGTGIFRSWEQADALTGETIHALQDADADSELISKATDLQAQIKNNY